MKTRVVMYSAMSSCPRERRVPTPYLPIVNAIPAPAPKGARRMTIATILNNPCRKRSIMLINGLLVGPICTSATPINTESRMT
ncbi:hypothetical protein D3C78_1675140 [compost metagenome]